MSNPPADRPDRPSAPGFIPPPAPPLPPARSSRVTNAFSRMFPWGGASRLPDSHGGRSTPLAPPTSAPQTIIPSSSQNAIHRTGLSMSSLAKSPDGLQAVLAGERVFKTIKVDGATITDGYNIRAALGTRAPSHLDPSAADQIDIKDVKWSHDDFSSTIVTASANGRITIYDLERAGANVEVARIQEHYRQVHRLAISPFKGSYLLSASQDGTTKLFDLRSAASTAGRGGSVFVSKSTFKGNADAVRDVKWSTTDGMMFACSTDSGVVQKWDIRNFRSPLLRIHAHDTACLSIDWHPDGQHLISGGLDQYCCVWDFSATADKRQKKKYTFETPAPVGKVSWRPACWSSSANSWRAAQVAVVHDDSNIAKNQIAMVNIWDLARPGLPFKEIEDWDTSPTDLVWHDRDLFWTVTKDGQFSQSDVAFAPKTIDRRSLSTFDIGPDGNILMVLQERDPPVRSRPSLSGPTPGGARGSGLSSQGPNSGGPSPGGMPMSTSRSESDEELAGSFLNTRPTVPALQRSQSVRSNQSFSRTPLNAPRPSPKEILNLEQSIAVTGEYQPQQVIAIGRAPHTIGPNMFQYLSHNYLVGIAQYCGRPRFEDELDLGVDKPTRLRNLMEMFAQSAERAEKFRLGQSWRLLSYSIGLVLPRRAEFHRKQRVENRDQKRAQQAKQEKAESKAAERQKEFPQNHDSSRHSSKSTFEITELHAARNARLEEIESTSNMTTPQARPFKSSIPGNSAIESDSIETDTLLLPPSSYSEASRSPTKGNGLSTNATSDRVKNIHHSMAAIDIATSGTRLPSHLQVGLDSSVAAQANSFLQHVGSLDSLQMFSSSEDSYPAAPPSSSQGSQTRTQSPRGQEASHDRDIGSSWDSSISSGVSQPPFSYEPDQPGSISGDALLSSITNPVGPSGISLAPPKLHVEEMATGSYQERSDDKAAPIITQNELHDEDEMDLSDNESDSSDIIERDYYPQPDDPLFVVPPLNPEKLFARYLEYECLSNSITPAAMILLLRPYLSEDAVDPYHAEAILTTLQDRLLSQQFFYEALILRHLCKSEYPNVTQRHHGEKIGLCCSVCNKTFTEPPVLGKGLKCKKCNRFTDPCQFCKAHDPPLPSQWHEGPPIAPHFYPDWKKWGHLQRLCLTCTHGGHQACLEAWLLSNAGTEEEGKCLQCDCACEAGIYADRLKEKAEEEELMAEARRKEAAAKDLERAVHDNLRQPTFSGNRGVRRDSHEVAESRAIETVRGTLPGSGNGGGNGGTERKKSVKFATPKED